MILKKRKTNSLAFKRAFEIVKQRKFFFGAILISLYSVMLLGLGYTLQRHDFYGLFLKPVLSSNYKMIGNAVPPIFSKVLAKALHSFLSTEKSI